MVAPYGTHTHTHTEGEKGRGENIFHIMRPEEVADTAEEGHSESKHRRDGTGEQERRQQRRADVSVHMNPRAHGTVDGKGPGL